MKIETSVRREPVRALNREGMISSAFLKAHSVRGVENGLWRRGRLGAGRSAGRPLEGDR